MRFMSTRSHFTSRLSCSLNSLFIFLFFKSIISLITWSVLNGEFTRQFKCIFTVGWTYPLKSSTQALCCTFPGEVSGWMAVSQQQKLWLCSLSETQRCNTSFLISHWSILLAVSTANQLFEMKTSNLSKHGILIFGPRSFQNCETFDHKPEIQTYIVSGIQQDRRIE